MFNKTVKEVMTTPVVKVNSSDTLSEAARRMRDEDIGLLAVCDGESCTGIITDRDICVRAVAEGKDPGMTKIGEVMSHQPVHVYEDQSLKEAERLMEERKIRRLLVFDRSETLCGVISLSDIVGIDRAMTGRIVEKVSQPAAGMRHH